MLRSIRLGLFAGVVTCFYLFHVCLTVSAQSNDEWRLHGVWNLHKAVGTPCQELIQSISYTFEPDGRYEIHARMNRIGGLSDEHAKGTYELVQGTILGVVNGSKIGPFPYRFEGEYLVIQEGAPVCRIYLKKAEER